MIKFCEMSFLWRGYKPSPTKEMTLISVISGVAFFRISLLLK